MITTHIPWIYRRWPAIWGVLTIVAMLVIWLAFGEETFTHPYWYAWVFGYLRSIAKREPERLYETYW